jgi:tetratricopeptide (TPR) repeat protein
MNTVLNAHTEDLLVKYMDGTLSVAEEQEFTSLLTTDPSFAEEVRAVADFDEFLENTPLAKRWESEIEKSVIDTGFLADVQRNTAETVFAKASSSAGAVAQASSQGASQGAALQHSATLLSKSFVVKSLVVAAAAGVVGIAAWKYNASRETALTNAVPQTQLQQTLPEASSSSTSSLQNTPQETQSKAETRDIAAQKSNPTAQYSSSNKPILNEEPSPKASENLTAQAPPTVKPEAQNAEANANILGSGKYQEQIEQFTQQYRTHEQSGEATSAAFSAKRLGMLLCKDRRFDESASYFAKALKTAQNLKLKELEGEIIAEQAVLYKTMGNTDKAISTLRVAIGILTDAASNSLPKWSSELERWEKR